jgi:hypothetical protein
MHAVCPARLSSADALIDVDYLRIQGCKFSSAMGDSFVARLLVVEDEQDIRDRTVARGGRGRSKPFVAKALIGAVDEVLEGRSVRHPTEHGW